MIWFTGAGVGASFGKPRRIICTLGNTPYEFLFAISIVFFTIKIPIIQSFQSFALFSPNYLAFVNSGKKLLKTTT